MSIDYKNMQIPTADGQTWHDAVATLRELAEDATGVDLAAILTVLWWKDETFTVIPAAPDDSTANEQMSLLHAASAAMLQLQQVGKFKRADIRR